MATHPGIESFTPDLPLAERLRAAGFAPLSASAWVEVDLEALEANARALREMLPDGALLGIVVKANGYGHGLEMAASAAVGGGADWLVVSALDEARILRRAGIGLPVLVTYPVPAASLDEAALLDVDVSVGDEASVEAAVGAGARRAYQGLAPLRVQLEVDTGMARGGAPAASAVVAARRLAAAAGVELRGAWSHLASAEDAALSRTQAQRYEAVLAALAGAGVDVPLRHMAASEGLFRGTCPVYDLVRVGDAFYGGDDTTRPGGGPPLAPIAARLRPALALKARAVRLAEVPTGTPVGYGGTWRAGRPSLIATLAIGY
ncbi:MAG: alanine racemase, partial [Thermoleophilia bacterium]|nr:alanine racemase [Thermoleophilia bacterium]